MAIFKKISYSTRAAGARLVVTGMRTEQVIEWQASSDDDMLEIRYFAELDAGAEWCEAEILKSRSEPFAFTGEIMRDWLHAEVGNHADTLLGYMQRCTPVAGELLCRQDDPADEIYFIESGRIAISLAVATGETQRLRTLGPKTVLGEMGLYRSARRSANVVVIRTIADRLEFSSALVAALQR